MKRNLNFYVILFCLSCICANLFASEFKLSNNPDDDLGLPLYKFQTMKVVEADETVLTLPPAKNNPRNSEGAFVQLKDGSIYFLFSRYTGNVWGDNAPADLACRRSFDGGKTWTDKDEIVIKNPKNGNVMSVSLLRLQNGDIAMLYLMKAINSDGVFTCMPMFRISKDECKTWSEPVSCIAKNKTGYYVVNNDRLVQLKSGRLIFPASLHRNGDGRGIVYVYYSDNNGKTWKEGRDWVLPTNPKAQKTLQEPGLIELKNGTLMMWARTDLGCQYKMFSYDKGESWTTPEPALEFKSEASPLSMKRNPKNNTLVAVWSDRDARWGLPAPTPNSWGRTPLVIAVSRDEGKTWKAADVLEADHKKGYCYTAMLFTNDNSLLLGYCIGGEKYAVLQTIKMRKLKLKD